MRAAVTRGDKVEAGRLLTYVLRTQPSADAWHLAALFTDDRDEALAHLQRALLLDPRHRPSLRLLRKLDGKQPSGALDLLAHEYVKFACRQCQRSRWLVHLPRPLQVAVVTLLPLVLVVALLVVLMATLPQPSLVAADSVPSSSAPLRHLSADEIVLRLATSGASIARIERLQDSTSPYKQFLRLIIDDSQALSAQVIVYANLSALLEDDGYLHQLNAASHVIAANNAVLVYPRGLAAQDVDPLVSAFSALIER